ncbi:MAG TPA: SpoIID/LytB domain-containing protein, partial [bacterium]|nr:SpoIID/LytB domain-containing protein [bacterium]
MRTLSLACLLALTLAGCAEVQPQDDPFALSRPPDRPLPQALSAEGTRIRVAIVVHQPSVRLSAPDAFILTGLSLEGTPEADGTGKRLKDIELTPRQIDGPRAVLTPQGQGEVEIDGKPYRGSIVILDNGDGTLTVVNDVDLEDYVMGVVAGEVPRNWPLEALKAQALAARTFAVLKREQAQQAGSPYDLENSSLFQMYKGSGFLSDGIRQAVQETQGEIITYGGRPIEAFFHSNCGGETCGAKSVWGQDKPYLKPVVCGFCRDGAHFRWTAEMAIPDLVRKL